MQFPVPCILITLNSICYHIVRTISYSYIVLTFIGTQALRFYLEPTLLIYSHKYFSYAIFSIVSEPSSQREAWLLIAQYQIFKILGVPAIHLVFYYILLYNETVKICLPLFYFLLIFNLFTA